MLVTLSPNEIVLMFDIIEFHGWEVSEENELVEESEVVETESTENLESIEDEIIEDELSEAE